MCHSGSLPAALWSFQLRNRQIITRPACDLSRSCIVFRRDHQSTLRPRVALNSGPREYGPAAGGMKARGLCRSTSGCDGRAISDRGPEALWPKAGPWRGVSRRRSGASFAARWRKVTVAMPPALGVACSSWVTVSGNHRDAVLPSRIRSATDASSTRSSHDSSSHNSLMVSRTNNLSRQRLRNAPNADASAGSR